MSLSFGTKYWVLFLILIFAASSGAALIMYFRNKDLRDFDKKQFYLLGLLRFISVFLLSFMLLSPLLKTIKKIVRKPLIIVACDNSQSVITRSDSVKVAAELSALSGRIAKETGNDYENVRYTFGEKTERNGSINLQEKKSDYSEMINTVYNNHFNDNVGALVVAGDGIFNKGENPVNTSFKLGFPVYTLGFGDTAITRDARISNLVVNKIAFAGNLFPVEADLRFLKLKGIPLKFTVSKNQQIVYDEQIIPPSDDLFRTVSVVLEAGEPGLHHFTLQIVPNPDEINTENNTRQFVINVLGNKQKIMFISDGPHPDIGAIKNVLDARQNYEVVVFNCEPYPSDFKGYNLIILNQVPGKGFTAGDLLKKILDSGVPILFMIGNHSFLPQFNQLGTGLQIDQQAGTNDEAQAFINPLFVHFTTSEELNENIQRFPPLIVPFADYKTDPTIAVIMFQKVKNIATSRPLIATGNLGGKKTGFIVGEGIWRWRLYNYYFSGEHRIFDEFINQLIQYLALRENEDNFNIYFQNVYTEIDNVVVSAELFNDSFERISGADISLEMTREDGSSYKMAFDKLEQSYRLNAGILPVGDYRFTARVVLGEKTFTETGNFAVVPLNSESTENEANFRILYQISMQTGGKFYESGSTDQLISNLKVNRSIKPVNYYQAILNEALNLKILFILAVFLLGAEWFLRKFWGLY